MDPKRIFLLPAPRPPHQQGGGGAFDSVWPLAHSFALVGSLRSCHYYTDLVKYRHIALDGPYTAYKPTISRLQSTPRYKERHMCNQKKKRSSDTGDDSSRSRGPTLPFRGVIRCLFWRERKIKLKRMNKKQYWGSFLQY